MNSETILDFVKARLGPIGFAAHIVKLDFTNSFRLEVRYADRREFRDFAPGEATVRNLDAFCRDVLSTFGIETSVEQEIQSKGLNAPRVTPADVEAEIASEHYFTALDGALYATGNIQGEVYRITDSDALGLLTFCVLVLRNGFTVTGESACASPENFDAELGRKLAREKAVEKLWPLLGFRLKDRLAS